MAKSTKKKKNPRKQKGGKTLQKKKGALKWGSQFTRKKAKTRLRKRPKRKGGNFFGRLTQRLKSVFTRQVPRPMEESIPIESDSGSGSGVTNDTKRPPQLLETTSSNLKKCMLRAIALYVRETKPQYRNNTPNKKNNFISVTLPNTNEARLYIGNVEIEKAKEKNPDVYAVYKAIFDQIANEFVINTTVDSTQQIITENPNHKTSMNPMVAIGVINQNPISSPTRVITTFAYSYVMNQEKVYFKVIRDMFRMYSNLEVQNDPEVKEFIKIPNISLTWCNNTDTNLCFYLVLFAYLNMFYRFLPEKLQKTYNENDFTSLQRNILDNNPVGSLFPNTEQDSLVPPSVVSESSQELQKAEVLTPMAQSSTAPTEQAPTDQAPTDQAPTEEFQNVPSPKGFPPVAQYSTASPNQKPPNQEPTAEESQNVLLPENDLQPVEPKITINPYTDLQKYTCVNNEFREAFNYCKANPNNTSNICKLYNTSNAINSLVLPCRVKKDVLKLAYRNIDYLLQPILKKIWKSGQIDKNTVVNSARDVYNKTKDIGLLRDPATKLYTFGRTVTDLGRDAIELYWYLTPKDIDTMQKYIWEHILKLLQKMSSRSS